MFNKQLTVVLPLVDFSQTHLSWSLAHSICKLTSLVFMETKVNIWNKIMDTTMSKAGRANITVNRPRALRAKERGNVHIYISQHSSLSLSLFTHTHSCRRSGG